MTVLDHLVRWLEHLSPSKPGRAHEPPPRNGSRRSYVEMVRSSLRPDQDTWLVARAVSLRAF